MIDWALNGGALDSASCAGPVCGHQVLGNPAARKAQDNHHVESVLNSSREAPKNDGISRKKELDKPRMAIFLIRRAYCSRPTLDSQRRVIRTLAVVEVLAEEGEANGSCSGPEVCWTDVLPGMTKSRG